MLYLFLDIFLHHFSLFDHICVREICSFFWHFHLGLFYFHLTFYHGLAPCFLLFLLLFESFSIFFLPFLFQFFSLFVFLSPDLLLFLLLLLLFLENYLFLLLHCFHFLFYLRFRQLRLLIIFILVFLNFGLSRHRLFSFDLLFHDSVVLPLPSHGICFILFLTFDFLGKLLARLILQFALYFKVVHIGTLYEL